MQNYSYTLPPQPPPLNQLLQSERTIARQEISYELKPFKKISYVQVPVFEAQHIEETHEIQDNSEYSRLLLLLKEKEIELESLKSYVMKSPETPIPYISHHNDGQEQALMELQLNYQRLLQENKRVWQDNQDLKDALEDSKRERAKKAGIPPPRDDSKRVRELEELLKQREGVISSLQEELSRIPHYEELIRSLREEIDRLNKALDEKTKIIGRLTLDLDQSSFKTNELVRNNGFLEDKISGLIKEKENLTRDLEKFQGFPAKIRGLEEQLRTALNEIEGKNREIDTLERTNKSIPGLENRIEGLNQELRRSQSILKTKEIELEGLKGSYEDLTKILQGIRGKIQELEDNLLRKSLEINSLNEELTKLKLFSSGLQVSYEEKLQSIIRDRDSLLLQVKDLQNQIQVLINDRETLQSELSSIKFKYESFIQTRIETKENYEGQLKSLNGLLKEYEQRILVLTKEKGALESAGPFVKDNQSHYESQISALKQDINLLEGRNRDTEERNRGFSSQINNLNKEITRITTVLKEKENVQPQEEQGFKEIQNKIEGINREKEIRLTELREIRLILDKKQTIYEGKIQELNKIIQGLEDLNIKERMKFLDEKNELMAEIDILKTKVKTLESLYSVRMNEHKHHQEQILELTENRIAIYQKEKQIFLEDIVSLRERILSLEIQLQDKQQNFNRYLLYYIFKLYFF